MKTWGESGGKTFCEFQFHGLKILLSQITTIGGESIVERKADPLNRRVIDSLVIST